MPVEYLHGVETIDISDGTRAIQTVKSSVVGLVGTAPNADPAVFPLNTPVAVIGNIHKAVLLGTAGTLKDSLDAIFKQRAATVVVVRVAEGNSTTETLSNLVGSPTLRTGVWALTKARAELGLTPKILIAPGFTSQRPTSSVVNLVIGAGGSGYTLPPTVVIEGTGDAAQAVASLTGGVVTALTVASGGAGYSTGALPSVSFTGGSGGAGTVQVKHGRVVGVTITSGGSGYTNGTAATFAGGGGTGATGTIVVTGGVITGVTITNGGSGYVGPTTVTISSGTAATATSAVQGGGVISATVTNQGRWYTSAPTVGFSGGGGTGAAATAEVAGGKVVAIRVTNPGSGYSTPPTVTLTSVGTGATATATLGTYANPVGVELSAVSNRLRAIALVDGPATTYEDAVQYRNDYGNARVMVIDPAVKVWDTGSSAYVTRPSSAFAAGLQAKVDVENGFWFPFSNYAIEGVGGMSRPIEWVLNDRATEANALNSNEITTVIQDDGYRFWGVRGTGSDPLWAFLSVRRTADMIYESLELAHRWAMDKPFSYQLLEDIINSVRAYLRLLRSRGALIGGDAWIDPDLNTPQTFSAGELTVDFDIEPPAPLERLQFRAHRNPEYYTDFVETFQRRAI